MPDRPFKLAYDISVTGGTNPRAAAALEEVMENFAELMQRLLEIQSGSPERAPALRV